MNGNGYHATAGTVADWVLLLRQGKTVPPPPALARPAPVLPASGPGPATWRRRWAARLMRVALWFWQRAMQLLVAEAGHAAE